MKEAGFSCIGRAGELPRKYGIYQKRPKPGSLSRTRPLKHWFRKPDDTIGVIVEIFFGAIARLLDPTNAPKVRASRLNEDLFELYSEMDREKIPFSKLKDTNLTQWAQSKLVHGVATYMLTFLLTGNTDGKKNNALHKIDARGLHVIPIDGGCAFWAAQHDMPEQEQEEKEEEKKAEPTIPKPKPVRPNITPAMINRLPLLKEDDWPALSNWFDWVENLKTPEGSETPVWKIGGTSWLKHLDQAQFRLEWSIGIEILKLWEDAMIDAMTEALFAQAHFSRGEDRVFETFLPKMRAEFLANKTDLIAATEACAWHRVNLSHTKLTESITDYKMQMHTFHPVRKEPSVIRFFELPAPPPLSGNPNPFSVDTEAEKIVVDFWGEITTDGMEPLEMGAPFLHRKEADDSCWQRMLNCLGFS